MTELPSTQGPIYSTLGGDGVLTEIVEMFVDEMPDRIAALSDQLNRSDWEALCRMAHQLKGSAGSYGFEPISPCAGRLEDSIREDRPEEQIHQAVAELVDMCRRTRAGVPTKRE